MQSARRVKIVREIAITRTPRLMQIEGLFDITPAITARREWDVVLPIDSKPWNIGLILGPSGCGKSTILTEVFGAAPELVWPKDQSLIDGFPKGMGIKDITGLLNAVGFSSPPSWLKPFHVLSNGERFRVTLARLLAEHPDLVAMDEFTSVVDRVVAKIGSAAVAKTVRARNQKFVAAACHYDIVDWLQPDWIYEPDQCRFQWRLLRRHPTVELEICRVDRSAWALFRAHHYLDHDLNPTSQCFAAFYGGIPVAFEAVISFPHPTAPGWRAHRIVTLPDYQGIGIGSRLSDTVASMLRGMGKRFRLRTSAPGLRAYCHKSKAWTCTQKIAVSAPSNFKSAIRAFGVVDRMAETFEYVGPPMAPNEALSLWRRPA